MAQRVVGIDVGSTSIKVVHLSASMRAFNVVAYHEEPVPDLRDDQEQLLPYFERAAVALKNLHARGALRGDLHVTGLPGDIAATRLVRLPFRDARRVEATLPFEVEAVVPFDLDDMIMTHTVLSGEVDGETDVLVGLARKGDVQAFVDVLKQAGVDPRHVELDALALDDLYLHLLADDDVEDAPQVTPGGTAIARGPEAYTPATAIIDIGHCRTAVCVMAEEQVVTARTILRGGADLTRALAKTFGLSLEQAEQGKLREAYLEVPGAKAPFEEQRKISNCLRGALAPIVREIRQSIQAVVASRHARVNRIFLCGGGSRIANLDQFLAAELNVDVRRTQRINEALAPALPMEDWSEPPDMSHAAKALAYALSGFAAGKTNRLDFRQGEMAYRGDFEFLEGRAPQLAAGLLILAMLLGLNGYARYFDISHQEAAVRARQQEACKSILGQPVNSAERCLAMINEQIRPGEQGQSVPDRSANDAYLEVARAIPKNVEVKVQELEITLDRVRVKGQTENFAAVDKIVAGLEKARCFTNVQRGPARQSGDKVGYSVSVDVDCGAKPKATSDTASAAAAAKKEG